MSVGALVARVAATVGVATALGAIAGCTGGEAGDAFRERRPPTVVALDGSPLLFPLVSRAGVEFEAREPDVDVDVRRTGTEEGFDALCAGTAPVALAARLIGAKERAICRQNGNILRLFPMANEGLAVIAHPDLEIECLSTSSLRRVWRAGSSVREYGDLGQRLPEVPITAFGPPTDSESFDFFTRSVVGREGSMREEYRPTRRPAELVDRVAATPGAIGYVGYAELARASGADRVRTIAVDAEEGCVSPSLETVKSGRYPLARTLYAYVNLEGLRRAKVGRFLAFTIDRHESLTKGLGLVPMSRAQVRKARAVVGEPRLPQAVPAG